MNLVLSFPVIKVTYEKGARTVLNLTAHVGLALIALSSAPMSTGASSTGAGVFSSSA
jgi:hypothetical protein